MKKALSLLIVSLFLLSGCVINEKPKTVQEPLAEKESPPVKEEEPAPEAEPVPEAPAPAPEEPPAEEPAAPAEPDVNDAEMQYLDQVSPMLEQLSNGLYAFGELNMQASGDPSLLTDSVWVKEMAKALVQMQSASDDLKSLQPPPGMAEVHDLFLLAGKEIDYVVAHYPDAIDSMDIAEIEQCTEALLNVGMYMDEASALLGSSPQSY
ncbi:hypothetical protein J9317_18580 [Metabacillus sp. KIGAM252]|uniref:Uncharacterized protein n=1 Tax=Metabacillus flavus TaxID=2823519 RepID=A0ABS5LJD8_9BACI|nr:hypothetical protein [Metabacillus flavus]MBS2970754.1 hypothetical protein [Metabacillus flavus]